MVVFIFLFLVGWAAKTYDFFRLVFDWLTKPRKEEGGVGKNGRTGSKRFYIPSVHSIKFFDSEAARFYIPSIDYALEFFDYNIDEERVFGQGNHTWPLMERVEEVARENFGAILDLLGFSKGNFDGGLDSVMDNFRLTE